MAKTPTQRTLEYLRKRGCDADVVEKWIPQARRRKDAFGFIDIIYLPTSYLAPIVAVQTTSAANHAARRTKILALPAARRWCECGGRIQVWSWRAKKRKPGGVAIRYEPRIEEIGIEDFAAAEAKGA